jgi:hypothetical protein
MGVPCIKAYKNRVFFQKSTPVHPKAKNTQKGTEFFFGKNFIDFYSFFSL